MSTIGRGMSRHGEIGGHMVSVRLELVPSDERPIGSMDFVKAWRRAIGDIVRSVRSR